MSTGDAVTPSGPDQPATSITDRIPLSPLAAPGPEPVPPLLLKRVGLLDGYLVLLLLTFGFLIASFTAGNSDIYLHLASGRHLAGGEPGVTSFVAPDAGVSSTWLFDLGTYLVYRLGPWGGAALVALKALAVGAAGWFMLQAARRPDRSAWVPAVFAFAGVLVLSQRAHLQPAIASILLLAITLSILARAGADSRSVWLLPLVCVLWVNLDIWFLLGPVTILLFLVGESIQPARQGGVADRPSPARLALVLVASLVACLVNPHHVYAFASLPPGLVQTGAIAAFKSDPGFTGFFISPFDPRYFNPYLGVSAAGLSYFVLLAVGLLSFVLVLTYRLDEMRWWRVLVWLGAAALSAWTYRAIPFFAVVAGPITALNFLDLAPEAGSAGFARPSERRWAVSGRVFTAFVGTVALLAAIPGWLHELPHYRRKVSWDVKVDTSLRDACLKVKEWRERDGGQTGRNWYNTDADAAFYLAWFCPGESTYVDSRLGLFKGVAEEYRAVRRSLTGEPDETEPASDTPDFTWRKVFAERGVGFVLFHNSDLARSNSSQASLIRLYFNPDEFVPCFTEGGTAVFAWRAPGAAKPPEVGLKADFNRLAFGPTPVTAPPEPAPAVSRDWWRLLLQGEAPTQPGSLTALQHTGRFDALSFRYREENSRGWIGLQLASMLGQSAAPSGPLGGGILLPLRLQLTYLTGEGKSSIDDAARRIQQRYMQQLDSGPVASLYLAVRAARQALRDNPDDVMAQVYLAESYGRLASRTREQAYTTGLSPLAQMMRQSQVAAALNSVLKSATRPEQFRAAHQLLFDAQREPVYFELRVKNLREYLRLAKLDPKSEQSKQLEAALKEMTTQLKQQRDQYEVQSANKPVLEKARVAMENGLADTALNLLLKADVKDLRDRNNPREAPGATLIITLLLATGRVDEVRDALEAAREGDGAAGFGIHPLGLPAYELFQAQLGAATGDYERADRALAECISSVAKNQPYLGLMSQLDVVPSSFAQREGSAGTAAALLVGGILLHEAPQAAGMPWQLTRHLPIRSHPPLALKHPGFAPVLYQASEFLWRATEQQADLWAVRGWLALESGRLDQAREFAGKALSLASIDDGKGGSVMVRGFRSRPLTALVLQLAENRLARD